VGTLTTVTPNGDSGTQISDSVYHYSDAFMAPLYSKVNDNNDSTYIIVGGGTNFGLAFSSFSIPAGQYVRQFVVRARISAHGYSVSPSVSAGVQPQIQTFPSGAQRTGPMWSVPSVTAVTYYDVSWNFDASMSGDGMFTQSMLDGFELRFVNNFYANNWDYVRLSNVVIDVYTQAYPTVTSISPSTTLRNTLNPLSTWIFNNPDGPFEFQYNFKLFTAAQVATIGFNPNTTLPAFYPGTQQVVTNGAGEASIQLPALDNSTAYVIYIQAFEGSGFTYGPAFVGNGVWYTQAFSTQVPVPMAPVLTTGSVAADPYGPKLQVSIKGQNNKMPKDFWYSQSPSSYGLTTNCTVGSVGTAGVALSPYSDYAIQINPTTTGTTSSFQWGLGGASTGFYFFNPCIPGNVYAFQVWVKALGTPVTNITLSIIWKNSSGVTQSTSTSGNLTGETNTGFNLFGFSATAPATAAYALCVINFLSPTNAQNHYVSAPCFRPYNDSANLLDEAVPYAGAGYVGNAAGMLESTGGDFGSYQSTNAVNNCTLTLADTTKAHIGTHSNKITRVASGFMEVQVGGAPPVGGWFVLDNRDVSYFFSVTAQLGTGQGPFSCYATCNFLDANANVLQTYQSSTAIVSGSAWTKFMIFDMVPPEGSVYASGKFAVVDVGAAGNTCFLDDIEFHHDDNTNAFQAGNTSTLDSLPGQVDNVFTLERSIDSGVTWLPVRSLYQQMGFGIDQITNTFDDYEVLPGQTVQYRAYATGYVLGQPLNSTYSVVSTLVVPAIPDTTLASRWWLRDPFDHTNNMTVDVTEGGFQLAYPEDQAEFNPLRRTRKVVVGGSIKGAEMTLTLDFISDIEYNNFKALRGRQRVLLLQRPWTSEQWYVRLGKTMTVEEQNTNPPRRFVKIEAVEVDVPSLV
jgi:hypothetical protein